MKHQDRDEISFLFATLRYRKNLYHIYTEFISHILIFEYTNQNILTSNNWSS